MCFFDSCCKTLPSDDNSHLDNLNDISIQLALIRDRTDKKVKELTQRNRDVRASRNKKNNKSIQW